MIRPGLERIRRLLKGVELSWDAIHVAGTNGKGSICAYLSAMLHDCNVPVGRFTSPHIIDRWDGITVNEKPIARDIFLEVEDHVKWRNQKESIDATSFELMTATAYHIFNLQKIKVGVIECGMGGRLDATNIFRKNPLVTVISRLGMDHVEFLGNTAQQIATEKAGIMKCGTPCVVDSSSNNEFLEALMQVAASKGVDIYFTPLEEDQLRENTPRLPDGDDRNKLFLGLKPQPHAVQRDNMWCAYRAFMLAIPQLNIRNKDVTTLRLASIMNDANLPGRFQRLSLKNLTGRTQPVFLDGGHNAQAWDRLESALKDFDYHQTTTKGRVWVIACSKGRDSDLLTKVIQPNDTVIVVEFGPVDGMPWVKPLPATTYKPIQEGNPNWINMGRDIFGALARATDIAAEGPMVIMGSLYLVSDVLRIIREADRAARKDHHHTEVSKDITEADRLWKSEYLSGMDSTPRDVDSSTTTTTSTSSKCPSSTAEGEEFSGNTAKPKEHH